MPARAPASIAMLQTVIRASMESARIALPVNSMTCPEPPPTPIFEMTARMTSLAVTYGLSQPSTRTSSVFGLRWSRHCVARTCPTSLVPMPNASAPNAPWVAVWLSPQTMVLPGWVAPISGPMTWTMPWPSVPRACSSMPKSAQFLARASSCVLPSSSEISKRPFFRTVGMEWSIVASVRSGRRTRRPFSRSIENACGEVTSCTRCRSA